MAISLHGALAISQGGELKVTTYHNQEKTKYGFIIYKLKENTCIPIFSTSPDYPYESSERALVDGTKKIKSIQENGLPKKLI